MFCEEREEEGVGEKGGGGGWGSFCEEREEGGWGVHCLSGREASSLDSLSVRQGSQFVGLC